MALNIKLSDMRHKIQIQKYIPTQDVGGGYKKDWVTLYTIRAKVIANDGNEILRGGRIEALSPWVVAVRFSPLLVLDTSLRILLENGKQLKITSIINIDEKTRWIQMNCTEVK